VARVFSLFLCLGAVSAVWGQDDLTRRSSVTHLNVNSGQIVNLSTQCLTNDNTGGHTFTYDRQSNPFTVPKGFSFIITDIIIMPCQHLPNETDRFLVVVTIGGGRLFSAGYLGAITKHYHLTSGLVVPEETSLEGRNTTFSSDLVDVQLLGYFVRGSGLSVGEPFSPKP
jgi:hypothetical protein